MKAEWKERPNEQRTPERKFRGRPFCVVFSQAVAMMMEMRCLNGMHTGEHEDAEREEDQILRETGKAKAVMLRAVGKAKPG